MRGAAAPADRRPDRGARAPWAAAATAPTGVLWLLLSVERGALQGAARLQAGRRGRSCSRRRAGCCSASCWWPLGLGVTGAYLGTPLSLARDGARAVVGARAGGSAARAAAPTRAARCASWSAAPGPRSSALVPGRGAAERRRDRRSSARSAATPPAPTRRRRWPPRRSCGWRSAIGLLPAARGDARRAAAGQDPRPRAACARWRSSPRSRCRCSSSTRWSRAPCCGWRSGPRPCAAARRAARARLRDDAAGGRLPRVQYMLALGRVAFLPALALVAVAEIALLAEVGTQLAARLRRGRAGAAGRGRALGAGHRARAAARQGAVSAALRQARGTAVRVGRQSAGRCWPPRAAACHFSNRAVGLEAYALQTDRSVPDWRTNAHPPTPTSPSFDDPARAHSPVAGRVRTQQHHRGHRDPVHGDPVARVRRVNPPRSRTGIANVKTGTTTTSSAPAAARAAARRCRARG